MQRSPCGASLLLAAGVTWSAGRGVAVHGSQHDRALRWQPPPAVVRIHRWCTAAAIAWIFGRPQWSPEHAPRRRGERLRERERMQPPPKVRDDEAVHLRAIAEHAEQQGMVGENGTVYRTRNAAGGISLTAPNACRKIARGISLTTPNACRKIARGISLTAPNACRISRI